MPVNYFNSRYRKQVFGRSSNIQYKECSDRPNNYTRSCTHCVCDADGCSPLVNSQQTLQAENRRIYDVSRVPASEFSMNLAAFNVYKGSRSDIGETWNQSSDRAIQHVTPNPVPSFGNSTKSSLTRMRPGAMKPGGRGVDIKHNSYARYLNRIKGGAMIAGPYLGNNVSPTATVNNKVQKQNTVNCACQN